MPKKPKRKYHGRRSLLNGPGHHSTAAFVAEVEDTSRWKHGKDGDGNDLNAWSSQPRYTFQVSDCTRVVMFDLGFEDDEEMENNLNKINIMIDALTKFRTGLEIEQGRYKERQEIVAFRAAQKGVDPEDLD